MKCKYHNRPGDMCTYTGRNRDLMAHEKVCKAYKKVADKTKSKFDTMLKGICY